MAGGDCLHGSDMDNENLQDVCHNARAQDIKQISAYKEDQVHYYEILIIGKKIFWYNFHVKGLNLF